MKIISPEWNPLKLIIIVIINTIVTSITWDFTVLGLASILYVYNLPHFLKSHYPRLSVSTCSVIYHWDVCDLSQKFLLLVLKFFLSECFVVNCWKNGSCLLYHVSSMMSLVSCLLYHVSCIMSPVSCILYHVSCLLSHVSRLLSKVSCLTSPVSRLLSHVSCLTFPVSLLLSQVSRFLSHVSCSCLTFPVSCLLSHVSCLLSHVFCLKSPVSSLQSHVSRLLSHFFCIVRCVSFCNWSRSW